MSKSLKKAIDEECKSCIYCPGDGTWRQQVDECKTTTCNLHDSRPTTCANIGKGRPMRRKAIDNHCKECISDRGTRGNGTWRQQVAACSKKDCSLFEVRPMPIGDIL